jgi:hypothetical protein
MNLSVEAKAGAEAGRLHGRGRTDRLAQAGLALGVLAYWAVLTAHTIPLVPLYAGELKAIAEADWLSMWTWVDYGKCFRYSPTALLPLGLADRHVLAPLLGIAFPSPEFVAAPRLIPAFLAVFALLAVCTYRLCRFLELGVGASLLAGLFIGLNKGFAYYLGFVSTMATALLLLYSISVLLFGARYLHTQRRAHLIGYYLALLLAVGAWEQWINLLAFLIAGGVVLVRRLPPERRRAVWVHGILVPGLVGAVYLLLHAATVARESASANEAQFVFTYPSVAMMVEDVVVNASLHVASVVEPLVFPWPMLSQAVLTGEDIDRHNPYNRTYTPFSAIHYRGMADWYAGLLLGLAVCGTLLLVRHLSKRGDNARAAVIGLLLAWCGFLVHLPVMYRTYFVLPGYASLLDYKHALSILGFSVLVGWGAEAILERVHRRSLKNAFVFASALWIGYCNHTKVATSFLYQRGQYPW